MAGGGGGGDEAGGCHASSEKEENLNGEGHIIITYPVVNDRWGATDVATLFSLHFILFSASLTASQNFIPAHSFILS